MVQEKRGCCHKVYTVSRRSHTSIGTLGALQVQKMLEITDYFCIVKFSLRKQEIQCGTMIQYHIRIWEKPHLL